MSEASLSLIEQINEKRAQVQISALTYDMDWIAHQINTGDIIIDPEYQRLFQWDEVQESRLIESLILNLPLPPIYLVEEEDGRRVLLDGLQRICTYLHFVGEMPQGFDALKEKLQTLRTMGENDFSEDEENYEYNEEEKSFEANTNPLTKQEIIAPVDFPPLRLTGCDIIEDLNGKGISDLEQGIQRRLKHRPIDLYIYSYTSGDTWIQYQMFTRMNAGGSPLSNQQVRNAKIRIVGKEFIDLINGLSRDDYFLSLANRFFGKAVLINRKMELQEIILRLFAFANYDDHYEKHIAAFLDEYLEAVSAKKIPFNAIEEVKKFRLTCEILDHNITGKTILRISGKAYAGVFEALFITVFNNLDLIQPQAIQALPTKLSTLNETDKFPFVGGGKNTKNYHEQRKAIVKRLLDL